MLVIIATFAVNSRLSMIDCFNNTTLDINIIFTIHNGLLNFQTYDKYKIKNHNL